MVGAETWVTVMVMPELASKVKTAVTVDSMPAKLPWLSSAGMRQVILKLALGLITTCVLFDGTM